MDDFFSTFGSGFSLPFYPLHYPFATVGNAMHAPGRLRSKAIVKVGNQTFNWLQPGAVPFPLLHKIDRKIERVDFARGGKPCFGRKEDGCLDVPVIPKHPNNYPNYLSAPSGWSVNHFADYWGDGVGQYVVTYYRIPYMYNYDDKDFGMAIAGWEETACAFKTKFKFFYFPKGS
jgi:hypothetical protein